MLGASTRRHSRPGGVQGRDCPAAKHTLSPCHLPQVFEVELIDWKSVKDIAGGLVTLHPAESRMLCALCTGLLVHWHPPA